MTSQQNKNLLVINSSVPHAYHGGGGLTAYSMLRASVDLGYNVYCIALASSKNNGNMTEQEHVDHLLSLGVKDVKILNNETINHKKSWFQKITPNSEVFLPNRTENQRVREYCLSNHINLAIAYHWEGASAIMDIDELKKVFLVGDPIDTPMIFRRQYLEKYGDLNPIKKVLFNLRSKYIINQQKKAMSEVLKAGNYNGAFANHHSKELEKESGVKCHYMRTPTPFPNKINKNLSHSEKFKILHIGHLQGIATISGVDLLVTEVLPILKKKIGEDKFEINLVGGHFEALPKKLQKLIKEDPCINVLGQVTPADSVFCENDILIVPTPIELGIRVRIITGFSFAIPIVAHIANTKGIPEMQHNENSMIGNNASSLADAIIKLFNDSNLKAHVGKKGNDLHCSHFSINAFKNTLGDIFQSVEN